MLFSLGRLYIGGVEWLKIDESMYQGIVLAKGNLIKALAIEERFDILLGNYREFEQDIVGVALRHSIWLHQSTADMLGQSREINRRIANLLSSSRMYRDHLLRDMRAIYGGDAPKTQHIGSFISLQYDNSASYRIIEALRNHVQHCGLPANSFSVTNSLTTMKPGAQIAWTVTPNMLKRDVLLDHGLNARAREDIQCLAEATDLKPHIRKYMDCLNEIQNEVRKQLGDDYASWEKQIQEAIRQFNCYFGHPADASSLGLAVVASEKEMPSNVNETHYVNMTIIELRKELEKVNKVRERLADAFVTGQEGEMIKPR